MARRRATTYTRITLDPTVNPATERVVRGVVRAVRDGVIRDGDAMPSSRVLADDSGIARSSVVCAYERLAGMGVLAAAQGRATVVQRGASRIIGTDGASRIFGTDGASRIFGTEGAGHRARAAPPTAHGCLDLSVPGGAAAAALDPQDWRRAWRHAVLGGDANLHHALAEMLRTTRGIVTAPDDLVVRPSVGAALADVVDAFDLAGREVAIEDPSLPGVQRHLAMAGARVRCIPVDRHGLRVDLIGPQVAAVHVTPARQWPTGVPLSGRRRAALLDWACRTGGVVIENDHDSAFTFDAAPPVPLAVQAGHGVPVVFLGTSAKLIATDLRIAWLVMPRRAGHRDDASAPVCPYTARALADYLTSGAFFRHHSRALRLVRDRRDAFVAAIAAHSPAVRVRGDRTGTEAVLALPRGCDAAAVSRSLLDAGFRCSVLADFAVHEQPAALVVHYGDLPRLASPRFAQALGAALASPAQPIPVQEVPAPTGPVDLPRRERVSLASAGVSAGTGTATAGWRPGGR